MSKFMAFNFRCKVCNHTHEDFVKPDVHQSRCPECNGESYRLVSTPRLDPRMGLDPSNATMADKWARTRIQRAKIEKAHYAKHGTDRTPGADTSG